MPPVDYKALRPCGVLQPCDLVALSARFGVSGYGENCHRNKRWFRYRIPQERPTVFLPRPDDLPGGSDSEPGGPTTQQYEWCRTQDPDASVLPANGIPNWNQFCALYGAGTFYELGYAGQDIRGHGIGSENFPEIGPRRGHVPGPCAGTCVPCQCTCSSICVSVTGLTMSVACAGGAETPLPGPLTESCFDLEFIPGQGSAGGDIYCSTTNPCESPYTGGFPDCGAGLTTIGLCSFYVRLTDCALTIGMGWSLSDGCTFGFAQGWEASASLAGCLPGEDQCFAAAGSVFGIAPGLITGGQVCIRCGG